MRRFSKWILLLALGVCATGARVRGEEGAAPFKLWRDVPQTPLPPFKAPQPERCEFENGLVVFLLEDHELPLIDLNLMMRFGEVHEPADRTGLADAVAAVMRSGGSTRFPGDKLDEQLDGMGASLNFGMGSDTGSGSLHTMKEDFARGLEMFADVLRNPAFPEDKIDLYLAQVRAGIAKRNDSPGAIAGRESRKALFGDKSPYARYPEYATLNKLDGEALRSFHRTFFHPGMFILGVSGDFKKDEMLALLRSAFGGWSAPRVKLPGVPELSASKKAKVLFCERPQTKQTTVVMGHMLDLRRDSKEYPAMYLVREVLAGGLSGRLFCEVRSKKGLAYSVGAQMRVNFDRPGTFVCQVITRNEQALDAAEALRQELVRMREHGVSAQELANAKDSAVNSFVFDFDSTAKILGNRLTFEFYGYPADYSERLLGAIQQATLEDVNRAARKFLEPDKCVLLGVGNTSGLDSAKSFPSLKGCQLLDVSIPVPVAEPMVIDPDRELRGKRLLADCLKASGGVEEFKKIKALRAGLTLSVKALGREFNMNACMTAQLPGLIRMDVAAPFGPVSQVIKQGEAWRASGSSVQPLKPEDARKNLRTLVQSDLGVLCILAQAREGYNVQALEPVRDGERRLSGVEIESQLLGRLKIWFDEESHLIVKMRYCSDGMQKEYDKLFSEHTQFGALTLARQVADKDPAGPQGIRLNTLVLNPPVPAETFGKLERAAAPAE